MGEGEGDPRSDEGQQVIKLGEGQVEAPLITAVIQAQLLEQMVKLAKLGSPPKGLVDPNTATMIPTPLFCSPEQIQSGDSLDK